MRNRLDASLFHVEHSDRALRGQAVQHQIRLYSGHKHLRRQCCQRPPHSNAMYSIQLRRQIIHEVHRSRSRLICEYLALRQ